MMNDRLSNLVVALGFKSPPRIPEYTIRTSSNLSFLERAGRLNTQDLRMLRRHVATSKTLWMTNVKTLYLSSEGINSLCEGAALILHASLSRFKRLDAQVDFFGATVAEAVAYFLSKLLNPRRKCDLEADFEHVVQRGIDSRALPGERRAFTAAKSVLAHCRAQRSFLDSGTYRTPAGAPEVSRALGQILGERLHTAYLAGAFSTDKARVLLRKPIKNPRESRKLYLDLLNDLANIEPARRSKKAWL